MLVVVSPGGHFSEARSLLDGLENVNYKYVTHYPRGVPDGMLSNEVINAPHAERDIRLLRQFIFAILTIKRENPKIVLSTGASIGITFGLAARIMGVKFIFIESPTRIFSPSLSCRIASLFSSITIVRSKYLLAKVPGSLWIKG